MSSCNILASVHIFHAAAIHVGQPCTSQACIGLDSKSAAPPATEVRPLDLAIGHQEVFVSSKAWV